MKKNKDNETKIQYMPIGMSSGGSIGMVIGVPLFAVVYMLFKDLIYDKLEKKGKSTNTKDYIDDLENIDIVKDKEEN